MPISLYAMPKEITCFGGNNELALLGVCQEQPKRATRIKLVVKFSPAAIRPFCAFETAEKYDPRKLENYAA